MLSYIAGRMGRASESLGSRPTESLVPGAQDFRTWLRRRTTLTQRSINDVVSRAKRVAGLIPLDGPADDEELTVLLRRKREYMDRSPSVRSQLKKAALLYRKFTEQRQRSRSGGQ